VSLGPPDFVRGADVLVGGRPREARAGGNSREMT
jgi:hypothetical protein